MNSSANKNIKCRWKIIGVIIIIFLIAGCIIGLAVKSKPVQTAGDKMGRQAVLSVFSVELEKQYIEFEKLFREQQDDVKRLVGEFLSQHLFRKKDFLIVFDEEWYLSMQWSNPSGNEFLYSNGVFRSEGNEELIEILNENTVLKWYKEG